MRLIAGLLVVAAASRSARADPEETSSAPAPEIAHDVAAGELMPGLVGATHDRREVQVQGFAGRDASTGTTTMSSSVEATLVDRVSARVAFANDGYNPKMTPTFGLTIDALRQPRAGVDLALGAAYATEGFNQVPALVVHAAVARHLGTATLLANVEYGAGLEQGERYGAAGLGAIDRLSASWYAGVTSQAHLDLELDASEPAEERAWDVQGGPIVSYALGPVVLSAMTGVAAWQLRLHPDAHIGAIGMLGAGAVF